jgi:hypothetical protein
MKPPSERMKARLRGWDGHTSLSSASGRRPAEWKRCASSSPRCLRSPGWLC